MRIENEMEINRRTLTEGHGMNLIKSLLVGAVSASFCVAQVVSISGKVTDTSGTPLSGATVSLEKGGQTATTIADGSFTLVGTGSINGQKNQSLSPRLSATIHGGLLWVQVGEKSTVEIITYNLQGQAISTLVRAMDPGTNFMAMPQKGAGIYLYKVRSDKGECALKGNSIGNVSQGTGVSAQSSSFYNASAKQTKVAAATNDVIAVTKAGYLNFRETVTTLDTSGMEIRMLVCAGTVTDVDGNVYQSVKIGRQIWTTENLRTTRYNDGKAISLSTSDSAWSWETTGLYCYFNNTADTSYIKKNGALYNWYAVGTRKLAPTGWHVPSLEEWDTLQTYLIANGYNYDGTTSGNNIAKSLAAKADWDTSVIFGAVGYNLPKNNRSGFSALPSGFRALSTFLPMHADFWIATEYTAFDTTTAYFCELEHFYTFLETLYCQKTTGNSVRLVKD